MTTTIRELARATALPKPSTASETSRSVEVVIATGVDCGDGVALEISREAITWPDVIPVLLDHSPNLTDRMAGRITELRIEQGPAGPQLVGLATFADAPAAEAGWALARSGTAVSVHAEIIDIDRGFGDAPDRAVRWRLRHVALTPMGVDLLAVTRSRSSVSFFPFPVDLTPTVPTASATMTASKTPVTAAAGEAIEPNDDAPETISRAELTRRSKIQGAVLRAGLGADVAEGLIERGLPFDAAVGESFRAMQGTLSQSPAGHPCSTGFAVEMKGASDQPGLADVLAARFGAKDADANLKRVSLSRALEPIARAAGIDPSMVSAGRVIERAYSTSDFATALLSSSDRTVLSGYRSAPEGVRALALRRPLDDFRAVDMLRLSMFGSLAKKAEGGEYQGGPWHEEDAATLKADEYGRVVEITRKAVINDDLEIFGRLLQEMGASAARLEAELLCERLLNGFTWGTGNSTTAASVSAALAAGTLKLRRQVDVSGARISFEPRVLLVPPELEHEAMQALSDRFVPTTADDVQPFRVTLAVDAQLTSATECYLVDTQYQPLALGTIGDPITTLEESFSTGNRKMRVQHDAAAAVLDQRSIVKCTIS